MGIPDTIAAFQRVHETVLGVQTAPTSLPASLNASDLPCVVTLPGPAVWDASDFGDWSPARTFLVRCYVAPVAMGAGIDEGYQKLVPILQRLVNAYNGDPTLGGTVQFLGSIASASLGPVTDSGAIILSYGQVDYHGFEVRVPVLESEP